MTIPKWNQTETTLSNDRLNMSGAGDIEYYIDVQRDVVRRMTFHQSAAVYVTLQQLIEQDYLPRSAYHYEEDGMGGFDVEITDQHALTTALEEYVADQDADDVFYESYEEQSYDDGDIEHTTATEVYEWGVN